MKGLKKAGFACFLLLSQLAFGQSIYSFQGLGSLNHQGMPNNVGMGELGIGSPTIWHVNSQNPANLVYNSFSSFQVGLVGDNRTFTGDSISGSEFDGGIRFLAYAFPIKPGKWTSSFGILPFSTVSYNTFSQQSVEGSEEVTQLLDERGNGGLTHFFWSNGFAIGKINFGLRINYTFGSIDKDSQISIVGGDVAANTVNLLDKTSYSDLNFLFGTSYRYVINDERVMNFGLIFSNKSTLVGSNTRELSRLSGSGAVIETVEVSNSDREFTLPSTLGFGLSYSKLNHYLIGLDVETQGWENSSTANNPFQNQTKLVIGGRWTPDYDNVNSYFKRATYRLGFNYTKTPYVVSDQSINDFGINFGASFPVSGFSTLDLGLKFGQLGTTTNGLIRESYYRIVLGATLNDRWFIKRVYD